MGDTVQGTGDGISVLSMSLAWDDHPVVLIVLPDRADGLPAVEAQLSTQRVSRWYEGLEPHMVMLAFPKFALDYRETWTLVPALRRLGIREAFSSHADFSGLSENLGRLRDAFHRASIGFDEKGVEAAAASAETGIDRGPGDGPPKASMDVDHPFLFVLYGPKNGAIILIGRFEDPTTPHADPTEGPIAG